MVNENAALSHYLFEVTQTQGIGKVPANALGDDIDRIVESLEGFSDQRHRWLLEKIRGFCHPPPLMQQNPLTDVTAARLLSNTNPYCNRTRQRTLKNAGTIKNTFVQIRFSMHLIRLVYSYF